MIVSPTGVEASGAVGDVTISVTTPQSFGNAAQQTVYAILNGNISAGVYDDVPFLPEGKPREDFPYVVIGEDTSRPWDTDDTVGQAVSIDLHVWSRTAGMKETKTIMGEIFDLLHRASPTISHYNVVDCLCIRQLTTINPDGRTRLGVMTFTLTLQKTS